MAPAPIPVIVVAGEVGVVIVPVPLINVQSPVPIIGVFAAMVAFVPQTVWLGPAAAVVGPPVLVMVAWEEEDGQGALEIVH